MKGYIRYVSAAIRTAAQEISWWNPAGGTANHDVDPTVADVSFKEMQLETQEKHQHKSTKNQQFTIV